MACMDSSSPTDEPNTVDSTPADATLSPSTSGQNSEDSRRAEAADASDIPAGDGQKPVAHGDGGFADEIQALKMKLLELERKAQGGSAAVEGKVSDTQGMDELEQYQRMEACLKKHRKEWERAVGPGEWGYRDIYSRQYMAHGQGPHPAVDFKFKLYQDREFQRPGFIQLFDEVANGQGQVGADASDEFDEIIDYGSRRDRLRKNFEWEMDRIYLVEEMDRRRREKVEAAKARDHPEPKTTETPAVNKPLEGDGKPENAGPPPPECAQPQLNRVNWPAFRQMILLVEEKDSFVVDILLGEPNIKDTFGTSRRRFGFSDRVRKQDIAPDSKPSASMLPGQPQLPERIRIHSEPLMKILAKIMKKEYITKVSVFIRPFKALTYSERALRDWCTELEKRLEAVPETDKDVLSAADDSEAVSQKDVSTPLQSGQGSGLEEASDSSSDSDSDSDGDDVVTKSPMALEHLKCLLSFVDSEISAKQAYLKSPDCRKVFFSDLWHLFRPGMDVTGSDGKQAYRVIHVASAKHRVAPSWERWYSGPEQSKKTPPFSITCVYIDFDGKNLGPVPKVFEFKKFNGEVDVTSLEVYPLHFHPVRRADFNDSEWRELEAFPANQRSRQRLVHRGAKFLQVAGVKHMYYAGPTLGSRDEVESQVVVDFETAFSVEDPAQKLWKPELSTMIGNVRAQEGSEDGTDDERDGNCDGECCRYDHVYDDNDLDKRQRDEYVNGLLPEEGDVNEQPSIAIIPRPLKELHTVSGRSLVSEDELVIMSYRVFGFVLRSRKWARLDLSHLTDVYATTAEKVKDQEGGAEEKKGTTPFDRLVLEEGHRPLILGLIAQHFRDKQSRGGQREEFDIVKGKGNGLILLLHGAPGVGKTSTAEGVAELFKKPLFQITCGDLGTTAEEVEKALETNFALANRWDCILLLDEADVFLAERTKLDFKRNGLVAVFLRVMEYYAGILFLTTNRVGDFDEAFTSRIHMSLYYPELDQDKTLQVFKLNILMIRERFARKGRKIDIDDIAIGSFATNHFTQHPQARWNGRQIRNACQTALALAEFKAQGDSHEAVLRPAAEVSLGLAQFKTVQKAYLKFAEYMNSLHGTNAARRAKEHKLRALWIDENNNIVAAPAGGGGLGGGLGGGTTMDKKNAFTSAARAPPPVPLQQRAPPTPEQYHGYQGRAEPRMGYPNASRMPPPQTDQFHPGGQSWDNSSAQAASPYAPSHDPNQGPRYTHNDSIAPRQATPAEGLGYNQTQQQQPYYDQQPQQPQQPQQAFPAGFNQLVEGMWEPGQYTTGRREN